MTQEIYKHLLFAEIAILVFFGIHIFLLRFLGKVTDDNLVQAFKIYGTILLIRAIHLVILFVTNWRIEQPLLAMIIAISSYYVNIKLLAISYSKLLNIKNHIKKSTTFISWIILIAVLTLIGLNINNPNAKLFLWITLGLTIIDLLWIGYRLRNSYKKTISRAANYMSDDIEPYIKWMRSTVIILFAWTILGPFIGFISVFAIIIHTCIGLILLVFLTTSFCNYLIEAQQINQVTELINNEEEEKKEEKQELQRLYEIEFDVQESIDKNKLLENLSKLEYPLEEWIESKGYLEPMTNIEQLALKLGTNRAYLSSYINAKYDINFRNWIASLRLQYSKEVMLQDRNIHISEVAKMVQYTQSSYSTIFKKHFGISVTKWRKEAYLQQIRDKRKLVA